MATVSAIRDGLRVRLATISGLRVHDTVPGALKPPVAIVVPSTGRPSSSFGNASSEIDFEVQLFVSRAVDRAGQDKLDGYLNTSGAGSIVEAIDEDETLGGIVDFAHVSSWKDYGFVEYAGIQYLGATVVITVGL